MLLIIYLFVTRPGQTRRQMCHSSSRSWTPRCSSVHAMALWTSRSIGCLRAVWLHYRGVAYLGSGFLPSPLSVHM